MDYTVMSSKSWTRLSDFHQCASLENSVDRGAWQARGHGVTKSRIRLSNWLLFLIFPWWLSDKEPMCQFRRQGFNPWVGKILWRRKWHSIPVFWPGKSHGRFCITGAWWAMYNPQGSKELDTTWQLNNNNIYFEKYSNLLFHFSWSVNMGGDTHFTYLPCVFETFYCNFK